MYRQANPAWLKTELTDRASLIALTQPPDLEDSLALDRLIETRLGPLPALPTATDLDVSLDAVIPAQPSSVFFPLVEGLPLLNIVEPSDEDLKGRQGRKDEAWEIDDDTFARLEVEFDSVAITSDTILNFARGVSWGHWYSKRVILVPLDDKKAAEEGKKKKRTKPRLRKATRMLKRKHKGNIPKPVAASSSSFGFRPNFSNNFAGRGRGRGGRGRPSTPRGTFKR